MRCHSTSQRKKRSRKLMQGEQKEGNHKNSRNERKSWNNDTPSLPTLTLIESVLPIPAKFSTVRSQIFVFENIPGSISTELEPVSTLALFLPIGLPAETNVMKLVGVIATGYHEEVVLWLHNGGRNVSRNQGFPEASLGASMSDDNGEQATTGHMARPGQSRPLREQLGCPSRKEIWVSQSAAWQVRRIKVGCWRTEMVEYQILP